MPLAGLSVSRKHRFVVVVGEWVVEPWFDDRLEGLWRGPRVIDPDASFPQSEVAQDAFDDSGLVDKGHDSHFVLALHTEIKTLRNLDEKELD